jgi:hypothetical protein
MDPRASVTNAARVHFIQDSSGQQGVQQASESHRARAGYWTGILSTALLVAASFAAAAIFSGAPLEAQPAKAGAGTRSKTGLRIKLPARLHAAGPNAGHFGSH